MSPEFPIGRREGQRLAFVPRSALETPEAIVREVVGMLNAEGGEVWIGLRSEAGVAVELQGVDDAEGARRRLEVALVDRIEPAPGAEEVRVEVVPSERSLLRVAVRPLDAHRPYASIRGPGRDYPVRAGSRLRHLSRPEIAALFAGSSLSTAGGDDTAAAAVRRLADEQRRVLESGEPVLWIGVVPDLPGGELDLDAVAASGLLTVPQLSGSHGLHSWPAALRGAELTGALLAGPRPESGRPAFRWETPRGDAVSLDRGGGLFAQARIDQFATGALSIGEEEGVFLFPDRFLGWVVSAFRILAGVTSRGDLWKGPLPAADRPAPAALVVSGIAGWRLHPGTIPRSPPMARRSAGRVRRIDRDFGSSAPVSLTVGAVRDHPDRCAFRLLVRFYESYGLREVDVPFFDPRTERFDWSLGDVL